MRRKLDQEDEPLIACFKKAAVEESEVVYVELGYKACRVYEVVMAVISLECLLVVTELPPKCPPFRTPPMIGKKMGT